MQENKIFNNKLKKFYVILFSLIILLIPIAFLFGIISDRENYKDEAIKNIEQSWAKSQLLEAPQMVLTIGKDKKNPIQTLTLGNYEVNVNIKTEIRKKGIFKVPVYTANVVTKGDFKNPYGALKNIKSELSFYVTDSKGFVEAPQFKIFNEDYQTVDENARLIGYETDLGTMKRHLLEALNEGENIIIGYTQTDANNIIVNGHEITIVGYKTDKNGKITFICNDTDDNIPRLIEYSEDYLLPKIHHAALPKHIVEKDLNIVPNYVEGINIYKNMKNAA